MRHAMHIHHNMVHAWYSYTTYILIIHLRKCAGDHHTFYNTVKVRRHTPWSRGPLSWIPGMLVHALSISLSISFATAQSSHNSEIYNIGAHAQ